MQDAGISQAHDALVGGGLHQPVLESKTANAVYDWKDATLLEVQRVAIAGRRDEASEQPDRRGESVDRSSKVSEKRLLSVDHFGQLGLGCGQQLRVARDRMRIIEDSDVQMGRVIGERQPDAEIRKIF